MGQGRASKKSLAIQDAGLFRELEELERTAVPENTRRAYRADWSDFRNWCARRGRISLPATAETVALYLTARAKTHKTSSLARRLTVIGKAHRAKRKDNPTKDERVKKVWRGILRTKGESVNRKRPTLLAELKQMLLTVPPGLSGDRDCALILFGLAGAMRRSELVSLNVGDLELVDEGYIVRIRRSKTDQTGKSRAIGIPYGKHRDTCPVRSMLSWLKASGIDRGAIFRKVNRHGDLEGERLCGYSVAMIVKRCLKAAGINPRGFAAHSLRSGLITAAANAGLEEREIMQQSGHRDLKVFRNYVREASLFRNNPAARIGL
jgi:integrase